MTIHIVENESIFDSKAEVITNANNSIGIMGAGLALAFFQRYPLVCEFYNAHQKSLQEDSDNIRLLPPKLVSEDFVWQGKGEKRKHKILFFPTMIYPGQRTLHAHIDTNVRIMMSLLKEENIKSIALPALGGGIGRFPFSELHAILEKYDDPNIEIFLHKPQ